MTEQTTYSTTGQALRLLWQRMSRARRRHLFGTLAVMLLGTLAELATIGAVLPFLAIVADPTRATDIRVLPTIARIFGFGGSSGLVLAAALLLVAAAVASAAARILLNWISLRFVLTLSHEIGREVFARMLRQPYSYYVSHNTSEVLSGIEKVQAVIWSILMPGMQGIAATVMSAGIVLLLFAIDPFTAAVASSTMVTAYLVVALVVRRRLNRNSEALAGAATQRVQSIQEGLGGIRDILLEQSQDVFEDKFRRMDYAYRRAQVINNFILTSPRYVVEGAGIVLIAALAVQLSAQSGGLVAAIPVLGALALGAQRVLPLLQQAYLGWSSLAGNKQMLIDVAGLLDAPVVSSRERDRAVPVTPFRTTLMLDRVTFSYAEREEALKGVSLTIAKGQCVGFVGETGSGKSTLLDILMGLLDPTSGAVLIDGAPLCDENRANWQGQIAHVPQAIFLADASIAANIAFGERDATIDQGRVEAAARVAHIHDFCTGLPEGYRTHVGERGVRLSGGQRQRIGIARAIYKGAPVLVFDEATSALDSATETAIMASIAGLRADITVLMIAHRTSTLVGCDMVVRLAEGVVRQQGTYPEVILGEAA